MKPKSLIKNDEVTKQVLDCIDKALIHNQWGIDISLVNGDAVSILAYVEGIHYHNLKKYSYHEEAKEITTNPNKYVIGLITERVFIENVLLLTGELFTITQIKSIIKKIADINKSESPTTTSKAVDKEGILRFVQNEDLDIVDKFLHSDFILTNTAILSSRLTLSFTRSSLDAHMLFKAREVKH